MGTPEFAATILRRLLAPDAPVEVVGVVTQPDRPVGRGRRLVPQPVKVLATSADLPMLQPRSLRRPAALEALQRLRPAVGVVAAYGRLLPPEVLGVAPYGYLNVHASLLPRWRGPWPIGAAILAGDAETGASIMRLDESMDTGPVLARRPEPIEPIDTTATLEVRLAALGAALLVETLPDYLAGSLAPQPQDERDATYCRAVHKDDGRLDWRTRPAPYLVRQIKAMQPWPVAWTTWEGKQLRVLQAHAISVPPAEDATAGPQTLPRSAPPDAAASSYSPAESAPAEPGRVVRAGRGAAVVTGEGWLVLDQVQLEGRGTVPGAAFVNGHRAFLDSHLH